MTETERIQDQMRRAFEGEAWHGPSLREALEGVTAGQAAARPVPGAHSIREIVLHLAAWEDAVRRRLEGETVEEPEEGDWPGTDDAGEAGWAALRSALDDRQRRLLETVARLHDPQLDEPPYEGTASRYATLHGAIQHTLYHAGQIVLLKKALQAPGGGRPTIARIWHGAVPAEKGDAYLAYLNRSSVPHVGAAPGNRGIHVLRRDEDGRTHFLFMSLWESWDAVRAFAGDDVERARYYPEDAEFLLELEPTVTHYEVVD